MSDQSLGGLPDATSRMGKTSDESFRTIWTMPFDVRPSKREFKFCMGANWRDMTRGRLHLVSLDYRPPGSFTTMDAKILCVEHDVPVLESRCAVLKYSGYEAASASPHLAEIVLRSRKFDLLVISSLNDRDLHRIVNFSDGAEVLVLDQLVMPAELLSLVAQRLNRQRRA